MKTAFLPVQKPLRAMVPEELAMTRNALSEDEWALLLSVEEFCTAGNLYSLRDEILELFELMMGTEVGGKRLSHVAFWNEAHSHLESGGKWTDPMIWLGREVRESFPFGHRNFRLIWETLYQFGMFLEGRSQVEFEGPEIIRLQSRAWRQAERILWRFPALALEMKSFEAYRDRRFSALSGLAS